MTKNTQGSELIVKSDGFIYDQYGFVVAKVIRVSAFEESLKKIIERVTVETLAMDSDEKYFIGYEEGVKAGRIHSTTTSNKALLQKVREMVENMTIGLPDPQNGYWDIVDSENFMEKLDELEKEL